MKSGAPNYSRFRFFCQDEQQLFASDSVEKDIVGQGRADILEACKAPLTADSIPLDNVKRAEAGAPAFK